jgi:hypothetical protein
VPYGFTFGLELTVQLSHPFVFNLNVMNEIDELRDGDDLLLVKLRRLSALLLLSLFLVGEFDELIPWDTSAHGCRGLIRHDFVYMCLYDVRVKCRRPS